MTDEFDSTFRGARFSNADFTSAMFDQCDMRQVTIRGSLITDLRVSGFAGEIEHLVINDVDVTAYVQAELDRRHPERLQLHAVHSAADHRAMWATIEELWADTMARAQRLPENTLQERVDGEWSFVETLRHLILATDIWLGRMTLGQPAPYHRLGLPPTDYPPEDAATIGLDLEARPTLAEVMDVRAGRMALMSDVVAGITDAELDEIRTAEPALGWGEETRSVRRCLRVVLNEECEHRRYVLRDLATLAGPAR